MAVQSLVSNNVFNDSLLTFGEIHLSNNKPTFLPSAPKEVARALNNPMMAWLARFHLCTLEWRSASHLGWLETIP